MEYPPNPDPQDKIPGSDDFWEYLDRLVETHRLVIDRPKGSAHPRYPELIYPIDYGYLDGTQAMDGSGVDIWMGSLTPLIITGIICSVDLLKREAEINILLGCSGLEIQTILGITNRYSMRTVFIPRPNLNGTT
jgi:inorganic pyrophosphatase